MRKLFAIVLVVAGLAVFAVAFTALRGPKGRRPEAPSVAGEASAVAPGDGKRTPVVVELFTSEGCSSCPPADRLLTRLEREQPVEGAEVVALAQHVDYWNDLGWADPFSSHEASERQGGDARALGQDGRYTPQKVGDGRTEVPRGPSGQALQR